MYQENGRKGTAILLAWPETKCKQAGAWYDGLMDKMGISRDGYYKVGHAAIVLINPENGLCHYFDFGRYHTPFGHGRVRDEHTDHDLKIKVSAMFNIEGDLLNQQEILDELEDNKACHGYGKIHGSACAISFDQAFSKAMTMQSRGPIKYGPFIWNGTNCSRFVRTVALAGNPDWDITLQLIFPWTISPTPIGNVRAAAPVQNPVFKIPDLQLLKATLSPLKIRD